MTPLALLTKSMVQENIALARRGAWFGLVAAASTSPGQTFFIGLFGNALREGFALSDAALGGLYGVATLASGLLMFWLGEMADRLALQRAITLSLAMVAAGAVLLATAAVPLQLLVGLFLLRLGGQGLSGHFAIVAAARFSIGTRRGRSVAVASMGFILGEALYPLIVTLALGAVDWRTVWMGVAVLLLAVYLPILRWLAKPFPPPTIAPARTDGEEAGWNRRRVIVSAPFLGALGVVLVPPFVITAIFFHQTALANRLDWTPQAVAQAFMLFAFCQAISTLLAGRLVDRFGARNLVRYYLLPMAGSLLATFTLEPALALWLLFAGFGVTAGANSVVGGAIWVEIFGSHRLGMIRGMYAALMVLSTAASPFVLGMLLSADRSLATIFGPVIAYIVLLPWLFAPLTFRKTATGGRRQ